MDACFLDASHFKDCAEGVQSVFVTLAVIIGGVWTLFTYTALGTRARAQRELFEQAIVTITIKAEQVWIPGDDNFYLAAVATLTNSGNRNAYLDFNTPEFVDNQSGAFKVSQIEFDSAGSGSPGRFWCHDISSTFNSTLRLRRGSHQDLPLFSRVPEPGLYMIEFAAALTTKEAIVDDGAGPTDGKPNQAVQLPGVIPIKWTGSTYAIVERNTLIASVPAIAISDTPDSRS